MSGIVAASQSGGCCCRPLPCQCTNPNRPGAIIDRGITALNINAEIDILSRFRWNSRPYEGCGACPCLGVGSGGVDYGIRYQAATGGRAYIYVRNGCVYDSEYEDEECGALVCRPAGCTCCPEYRVSANYGSQVVERTSSPGMPPGWSAVSANVFDHLIGSWNWQPRQVGHCVQSPSPTPYEVRVRRYCQTPFGTPYGVDPNGQFVDDAGNYTGGNTGPANYYATGSVLTPESTGTCFYHAYVGYVTEFQTFRGDLIAQAQGRLIEPGGIWYRKKCLSPYDTVFGTYECYQACEGYYSYVTDNRCGEIVYVAETDITHPQTITVS